jgi:hypothetical protein
MSGIIPVSTPSLDEYADEKFIEFSPIAPVNNASASNASDEEYADDLEQEDAGDSGVEEILHESTINIVDHKEILVPSDSASFNTKLTSNVSHSSLTSLPGLPSISSLSSSLTAAGRAHFAQQTSLFGRSNGPPPSNPITAGGFGRGTAQTNPKAHNLTNVNSSSLDDRDQPTPAALRAYAASNALCSSDSLGIHALHVANDLTAATTTPGTEILLDEGRLRIWTGSMDLPSSGLPKNPSAAAAASNGALSALSGIYLRAALVKDGITNTEFLHLPIDISDPLNLPPNSSMNELISDEGSPGPLSELHSCYHARRVGPYCLRVLGRGTSMPSNPESFQDFVQRANRIGEQAEAMGEIHATQEEGELKENGQSALDIQPRVTLYVAVEKLSPAPSGSSSSPFTLTPSRPVLPLLPIGCPTTFWLSTHQPSLQYASAAGAPSTSSLFFSSSLLGGKASATDHLELSLTALPMHARILDELQIKDVRLQAAEEEAEEKKMKSRKKQNKQKKKLKSKEAKKQTASAAAHSSSTTQPLVSVTITVPSLAGTSSLDSDHPPVHVSIDPSVSSHVSMEPLSVPSLTDLLATLAASPSTSLPSSILDRSDSIQQLAQQMAHNERNSVSASGTSDASLPITIGASSLAAVSAVPSESDVLLTSLQSRVAWPFSVSIDGMRVSEESEGHQTMDAACGNAMHTLHNKPLPARSNPTSVASTCSMLVGDHQVELLRTVGLLCAWERPRDSSSLNQPVLVSQEPHLSFHAQVKITRLDPDEANAKAMEALLDF